MNIRVINLGSVDPLRSQAVYHGLASSLTDKSVPIIVFLTPTKPYISVGLHQDIKQEIDIHFCQQNRIPIIRRHVGGGSVLLDENQLFFQYIFPKQLLPSRPRDIYQKLLSPIIRCYENLGLEQVQQIDNDIQIKQRKICGTGAASIDNASVLVGSFIQDFDFTLMARCINSPSTQFADTLASLMQQKMTTIKAELPSEISNEDLIELMQTQINKELGLSPVASDLSELELQYINEFEQELVDEEWTFQAGRKMVNNGIKITANRYLLEKSYAEDGENFSIRILTDTDSIEKIWIESETGQAKFSELEKQINQQTPTKAELLALVKDNQLLHYALEDLLSFQPY